MMYVQNEPAAPELQIDQPDGMYVWLPDQSDSGLGFGQGSTGGVFNTYKKRGFLRPELPPIDRATRRLFNLRGYRGSLENYSCGWPYTCHYDPDPFYRENSSTMTSDDNVWEPHLHLSQGVAEIKKTKVNDKSFWLLLFLIGGGWWVFNRR